MERLNVDWTGLRCNYCSAPAEHARIEDVEPGQDSIVLAAYCDECMPQGIWVHRDGPGKRAAATTKQAN